MLAAQVVDRDLSDSVTLEGPLAQDRVRDLMARATLLCAPCRIGTDGNRDALPTVLLEALACGLPSISTPVTGIPEILDEGRAGVIVPENDAAATARAIASLLEDDALRARLAEAGRVHVREHFDLKRSSQTLKGWFDTVDSDSREACASPA
jgi:glycosyltransferase involved in cell wall biosynthesis